jgi:mono/diheme cytochrome c family protein
MRRLLRLAALALPLLAACSAPDAGLPAAYREIDVPRERLADPAARRRGREVFLKTCALCHGRRGDGHGPRATSLGSPPTDLTRASWQRRATPRYVYWRIHEGVPDTDMPSWKAFDPEATWDLVAYVLSLGEGDGPGS